MTLDLNLCCFDALVVEVLVQLASCVLQFDAMVQAVHAFAVVGHRGPELVHDELIQEKRVTTTPPRAREKSGYLE